MLTGPVNESGELEFEAPDDYFSHVMAIPYRDATVFGGVFAPLPHRLLMFPSDLRHRVFPYEGSGPRYSVSYDLETSPRRHLRDVRCEHPIRWIGSPSAAKGSA